MGFAARGPVDRPVRISSFGEFEAIFGGLLELARDEHGAAHCAHLRESVAAFFEQGGKAAWIVRVTGEGARAATFGIPGLALHDGDGFAGAVAEAAWPGSFADGLRFQAQAEFSALPTDSMMATAVGGLTVVGGREHLVPPGSTLLIEFGGARYLCIIDEDLLLRHVLLERVAAEGESLQVSGVRLDPARSTVGDGVLADEGDGGWLLTLDGTPAEAPQVGDVLLLTDLGGVVLLLSVDEAAPQGDGAFAVRSLTLLEERATLPALEPPAIIEQLQRISLSLALYDGAQRVARIDGADFHPAGAAYVGWRLLDDTGTLDVEAEFAAEPDFASSARAYRTWTSTTAAPPASEPLQPLTRRGLAACVAPLATTTTTGTSIEEPVCIPVGLLSGALRKARGASHLAGDDGLATMPHSSFVDPVLVLSSVSSLLPTAHTHRYTWGRRALGLHALLVVEEIALLALPDAVQPSWEDVTTQMCESAGPEEPGEGACPADFRACGADPPDDGPSANPSWSASGRERLVGDVDLDALVEIHAAASVLAEARGDLLAVFALPRGYDVDEAATWRRTLRTARGLSTTGFGGESARQVADLGLCCAAHPWLVVSTEDGEGHRVIPPDGALCGVLARREFQSGAWSSPGSQAISGALGLEPWFEPPDLEALAAQQVVPVGYRARTTSFLGASTQSDLAAMVPIGVRRLLQFVRRECERLGERWVFEVNGEDLVEDVRVEMTGMLEDLHARGGLAGEGASDAFELAVGQDVDPGAADRGELVVRLGVAPSYPLEFIEVRLVRAGGELHWTATEA